MPEGIQLCPCGHVHSANGPLHGYRSQPVQASLRPEVTEAERTQFSWLLPRGW